MKKDDCFEFDFDKVLERFKAETGFEVFRVFDKANCGLWKVMDGGAVRFCGTGWELGTFLYGWSLKE